MREIRHLRLTDARPLQSDARKEKAKAAVECILTVSKNVRLDGLKLKDLINEGRR